MPFKHQAVGNALSPAVSWPLCKGSWNLIRKQTTGPQFCLTSWNGSWHKVALQAKNNLQIHCTTKKRKFSLGNSFFPLTNFPVHRNWQETDSPRSKQTKLVFQHLYFILGDWIISELVLFGDVNKSPFGLSFENCEWKNCGILMLLYYYYFLNLWYYMPPMPCTMNWNT